VWTLAQEFLHTCHTYIGKSWELILRNWGQMVIRRAPIGQGYGLTETCAGATFSEWDDNSVGRVGPPIPHCYIKVSLLWKWWSGYRRFAINWCIPYFHSRKLNGTCSYDLETFSCKEEPLSSCFFFGRHPKTFLHIQVFACPPSKVNWCQKLHSFPAGQLWNHFGWGFWLVVAANKLGRRQLQDYRYHAQRWDCDWRA
jgi:hypothetical protein